jgi:hypothetical protein
MDNLRFKAFFTVSGHFDGHRPVVGSQFWGRFTVTPIFGLFLILADFFCTQGVWLVQPHRPSNQGFGQLLQDTFRTVKIIWAVVILYNFIQDFFWILGGTLGVFFLYLPAFSPLSSSLLPIPPLHYFLPRLYHR